MARTAFSFRGREAKKIRRDGVEPERILPPTVRGRIGSECPVHTPKAQKT